jgi:signal peptidase I
MCDTGEWMSLLTGELMSGSEVELPVLSGSMYPFFCQGDRVKISCVLWNKCHIGDIIVFREGNQLTAHRLLFRFSIGKSHILYQKGDGSRRGGFITAQQIVGKVVEVINPDGYHLDLRKDRKGKRTIALRKLIVLLCKVIFRYGKELMKWILVHP